MLQCALLHSHCLLCSQAANAMLASKSGGHAQVVDAAPPAGDFQPVQSRTAAKKRKKGKGIKVDLHATPAAAAAPVVPIVQVPAWNKPLVSSVKHGKETSNSGA
jgi:hypothetical protein